MEAVTTLVPARAIVRTCRALGLTRASFYRHTHPPVLMPPTCVGTRLPRRSPRALSATERQSVLDALHAPRFVDRSPTEAYATLLDEGVYLASERTFYRLLAANGETTERRNQLIHPHYRQPELLATRPNEVWSWAWFRNVLTVLPDSRQAKGVGDLGVSADFESRPAIGGHHALSLGADHVGGAH